MTKEEIGSLLRDKRISCGMTQKEVADKLGRKQPIIGHWETGYSQPDANTLFTLCDIYGTTVDEIFGFKSQKEDLPSEAYDLFKKYRDLDDHGKESVNITLERETLRVKMLADMKKQFSDQAVHIIELERQPRPHISIAYYQKLASAGTGEYLFDSIPVDMIEVPENDLSEQADFVIGVNGFSMEPTYSNGDKVFVQITDEISVGSIGIFVRGNDCFIKELGVDRLISHNADKKTYPDIPASDDIKLVGKVLGKVDEI